MSTLENEKPSSPDNIHQTAKELLAERATRDRLAARSPWLRDSVSVTTGTETTSEAIVLTPEKQQERHDLEERRVTGAWDKAA